ncbi:MAG: hypothetical protein HY717_14420 [Planctomycetes bacterium]|nr:hypothetical protein [Planctomycetota bacterium]
MMTRLDGLRTPFGPLAVTLRVSEDGMTAALHIASLSDPSCRKIVVHLEGWAASGSAAVQELAPDQAHEVTLTLQRHQ